MMDCAWITETMNFQIFSIKNTSTKMYLLFFFYIILYFATWRIPNSPTLDRFWQRPLTSLYWAYGEKMLLTNQLKCHAKRLLEF